MTITVQILRCLVKYPDCTYPTMKRYLEPRLNRAQIFKALSNLAIRGYIVRLGSRKHLKYHIKQSGIDLLDRLDQRELIANVNEQLSRYLQNNGGFD